MSESEKDQVLDHEYDGIQEYDNRLPNWWLYTLYGAIVFAFLYWFYFHITQAGALPTERYDREMARAAEEELARMAGDLDDATLNRTAGDPARVDAGREIFGQFCVVCHGEQGGGSVGPNLTDAYWIHGGRPMDLLDIVTNGVLEKGMAAWGRQLGPRRVQDVVAFVLTLRNTDVPGKDPEGTLVPGDPSRSANQDPAAAENSN
jgi:cytochrome c oxidase cbb3-type subunit 3